MKRYAVADEVPEDCDYLTAGKEYEVDIESYDDFDRGGAWITVDKGKEIFVAFSESDHLNGKSWRIVEREE